MESIEQKLQKTIALRDKLSQDLQVLLGKREATESSLQELEKEITDMGLDPDRLDETVQKLEKALQDQLSMFEEQLTKAEEMMSKYMEN